jgi:hypothetical protein
MSKSKSRRGSGVSSGIKKGRRRQVKDEDEDKTEDDRSQKRGTFTPRNGSEGVFSGKDKTEEGRKGDTRGEDDEEGEKDSVTPETLKSIDRRLLSSASPNQTQPHDDEEEEESDDEEEEEEDEEEDEPPSITTALAETAQSVRETSKQLGRVRVKSQVESVMIITKARDNKLIGLTRQLAIWLMGREGSGRRVVVYVYDLTSHFISPSIFLNVIQICG